MAVPVTDHKAQRLEAHAHLKSKVAGLLGLKVSNRLLRQYLPKGADLRTFSQADLAAIAHELNHRPRKIHGYRTSAEVYADLLNSGDVLTA
ncbi:hypothetical protein [Streptomyces sp. NPDC007917]|uniref:hypothetical protein n=1 Tax=Streptomyces sp. NPDC007917 TaxID=3364793 RepID=UPI0036E98814